MLIVIGYEYGSCGPLVAQGLAQHLTAVCQDAGDISPAVLKTLPAECQALCESGYAAVLDFDTAHPLAANDVVVSFFVHSDMPCRIRKVAGENGWTPEEAEREILRRDRDCQWRYSIHGKCSRTDKACYDLMVKGDTLKMQGTVELLKQFVALKSMRNFSGGSKKRL